MDWNALYGNAVITTYVGIMAVVPGGLSSSRLETCVCSPLLVIY